MQKIHLSTHINAPKEKVWDVMLSDKTYREWTKAFNAGSYYKGSWEKGSKILFIGPGENGEGEMGMASRIAEARPYEFISIGHLGVIVNGVEDTTSELAKKWAPAFENYTFKDKNGGTELTIDMDIQESEKAMMEGMWKKGLESLKALAEK
jgi:hypothetical protein